MLGGLGSMKLAQWLVVRRCVMTRGKLSTFWNGEFEDLQH